MKIVQLTPYAMDRPGGVQTHIRDLSAWLSAQGHEVRIVAPPGDVDLPGLLTVGRARNISVHGTRFELSYAARGARAACIAELHDWGAEVAHLHTPWTPLLPWQIWRGLGVPGVATFHATLPDTTGFDPLAWALRRSTRYFNRHLHGIVVPSQAPLAQWRAIGAAPLPAVLPPAIDLSGWRAAGHAALPQDGFQVVCMGRLEERKGVSVLLEAWKIVHQSRTDATLIIAGHGPQEAALRAQVARDNIGGVDFCPPPSDKAARALVAQADVFVAPATQGESFGLVLIEAMAAGTVPVAAANSGYSTVMSGAGQGLLVPPGQSAPLAQKLLSLASHPTELIQMQRWARGHAELYDVRNLGPAYETLFRSALN